MLIKDRYVNKGKMNIKIVILTKGRIRPNRVEYGIVKSVLCNLLYQAVLS